MSEPIQHHDTGDAQPGSLPTGAVQPPLASQPVENEKIEPCPWCESAASVKSCMGAMMWVKCSCGMCEAEGPPRTNEAAAIAEWNSVARAARQQAGPVAQALEAYRVARAKWLAEATDDAWRAMHRKLDALNIAFDADAEATSTTPDADASANRGVQAGGEMMYPAKQFYAMRERAEKAETKWRELHDRAEKAEERIAQLGGSRVYTTTEYEKLRRRFHATRAQLRTAVVTIKTMERGSSRARDRVESFWMAARDRAEKAKATLAERDKRIATLEALLAEASGFNCLDDDDTWAEWSQRARAALEGKEAPRG